jgi:hypothetical protein
MKQVEKNKPYQKFLTRRNCSYQISDKNKADLNKESLVKRIDLNIYFFEILSLCYKLVHFFILKNIMIYNNYSSLVLLAFSSCSKKNLLKTYKLQETLKDLKRERFYIQKK